MPPAREQKAAAVNSPSYRWADKSRQNPVPTRTGRTPLLSGHAHRPAHRIGQIDQVAADIGMGTKPAANSIAHPEKPHRFEHHTRRGDETPLPFFLQIQQQKAWTCGSRSLAAYTSIGLRHRTAPQPALAGSHRRKRSPPVLRRPLRPGRDRAGTAHPHPDRRRTPAPCRQASKSPAAPHNRAVLHPCAVHRRGRGPPTAHSFRRHCSNTPPRRRRCQGSWKR